MLRTRAARSQHSMAFSEWLPGRRWWFAKFWNRARDAAFTNYLLCTVTVPRYEWNTVQQEPTRTGHTVCALDPCKPLHIPRRLI